MLLEKQVITLDTAKTLHKLGLDAEAIFYWTEIAYTKFGGSETYWALLPVSYTQRSDNRYAAYTVAELGEYLTGCISGYLGAEVNRYRCGNGKVKYDEYTEAEARARMLIWLIENKRIIV